MRTRRLLLLLAPAALAGCLDPLVDDTPGASVHVLPPGSVVPPISDDPERLRQITVHDGLDDMALADAGGVVARQTAWADGAAVRYWSFGDAPRAGAPVYVLVEETAGGPVRLLEHPYLLDSIPGDPGYSPIRRIQLVRVTARYAGEVLPTVRALADAIELGLVEEPEPTGRWVNLPVVPPGTRLEVGDDAPPAEAIPAYAGGYRVDAFELGGARGVQPMRAGHIPVAQVSRLQVGSSVTFLREPVFQLGIPPAPPEDAFNYTPLVTVVEVRLAPGVVAGDVRGDADLFVRSGSGAITAMTGNVASFTVTTTIRNWPIQFVEGAP